MKGIDIFCASQAATAICLSMEKEEGSSSTFLPLGSNGRTIDRYNPIIRDPRRFGIGKTIPSSTTTTAAAASASSASASASSSSNSKKTNIIKELKRKKKKKISAKAEKSSSNGRSADFDFDDDHDHEKGILTTTRSNYKSWRCSTKAGDFISPPGASSRYLLSDQTKFLNVISDFDPLLKLVPVDEKTSNSAATTTAAQVLIKNDHPHDDDDDDDDDDNEISPSPSKSKSPSSSTSSLSQDQVVVVLRVSLHCRGCERKMRKHISRMEGVSSFNIDFAAKKVTVVGNVTPLGVLNSISKVKTAQLWNPSNSSMPLPPTPPPSSSFIKNNSAGMMMMMMKPPPPIHFHAGT